MRYAQLHALVTALKTTTLELAIARQYTALDICRCRFADASRAKDLKAMAAWCRGAQFAERRTWQLERDLEAVQ